MNHAHHNFAGDAQRDRHAEVRNAIEKIHRAIDRVDDPLPVGVLVASDALLAVERVAGPRAEQDAGDQLLRFLVERQLDVVLRRLVDRGIAAEVLSQKFARGERGIGGKGEICHERGKNQWVELFSVCNIRIARTS